MAPSPDGGSSTTARLPSPSPAAGESLWKVHAVLVLVQFSYGGAYVLSKVALTTGVNPIVFAVYRDVIALCALSPLAYFLERGKRVRLDLTTVALFALVGIIGICISQLLLLFGIKLASASLSSVAAITIPVSVLIISAVFGLEDINWRRADGQAKVGGSACAVVGGIFVAAYRGPAVLGALSPSLHTSPGSKLPLDGNDTSPITMLDLSIETWQIGVILLFLAGIFLSFFITLQIPILKRYPAPISMTAFVYFFGALVLAIVGLITVHDSSEWLISEPSQLISALYVGLISSAGNYTFQAWALHKAGPVLVATYNPLQPFITSLLALIFIGERIYLGSVFGTLIIISGLFAITWGKIKGRNLGSLSIEAVATPDGLPTIKVISSLKEPLLT